MTAGKNPERRKGQEQQLVAVFDSSSPTRRTQLLSDLAHTTALFAALCEESLTVVGCLRLVDCVRGLRTLAKGVRFVTLLLSLCHSYTHTQ